MPEDLAIESVKPVKLIVGLGNPGSEYAGNRHNIGFMVIDRLLSKEGAKIRKRCQSFLSEIELSGQKILFQMPLTYMNSSGDAVRKLCRREKISPAEVLVIYDDLDIKPGRIRLRFGGGSGGHNGIKSITARLGTADYGRFKLGIGRPGSKSAVVDYVLQDFAESEKVLIDEVIDTAINVILMLCDEGYEAAMNTYNGKAIGCSGQPNQE
jgi:peptidyl-tRNA hydrolase, PTH1 family